MEQVNNDPSLNDLDSDSRSTDNEGRKPSDLEHSLSKITHNALENFGQGLKQLFHHQRRRSSVSPQDALQDSADQDHPSPDICAPTAELEWAAPTHPSAQTTSLNKVLQQFRVAPMMRRGASLPSRKNRLDLPRGSPLMSRKSIPDGTSCLLLQSGRPRSSSTTDAPTSSLFVESLAFCPFAGDEFDRVIAYLFKCLLDSEVAECSPITLADHENLLCFGSRLPDPGVTLPPSACGLFSMSEVLITVEDFVLNALLLKFHLLLGMVLIRK